MNELLNLLVVIILVGVFMWLVNTLLPMARAIKGLLNILVLIILIIYILQFFELIQPVIPMIHLIGPAIKTS